MDVAATAVAARHAGFEEGDTQTTEDKLLKEGA
jgi:hypothetical protein